MAGRESWLVSRRFSKPATRLASPHLRHACGQRGRRRNGNLKDEETGSDLRRRNRKRLTILRALSSRLSRSCGVPGACGWCRMPRAVAAPRLGMGEGWSSINAPMPESSARASPLSPAPPALRTCQWFAPSINSNQKSMLILSKRPPEKLDSNIPTSSVQGL